MIRRLHSVLFTLVLMGVSLYSLAEIRLPAVIGSNMVLQQQTKVALWGWGDPFEKVLISNTWGSTVDTAICTAEGKWKKMIKTPAAGGPYSIRFKGNNTIVIENVLIGEVWLCSGQSNMEWSAMHNNKQAIDEAPNATNQQIRFFHIPRASAEYPQEDCRAGWKVCNPEDMKRFSAIGYFFGKKLNKELGAPVGLINSSWGGTPAETWTPADTIQKDKGLKEAADKLPAAPWGPVAPGKLYNGMIAPIIPFTLAGALWYQGESNVSTAYMYKNLLSAMIASWRKNWSAEFPFYYVQIAPFAYGKEYEGAALREAQGQVSLPKTGMIVISDLVDNIKDIHPQNKLDVAIRLADMALADTYKKPSGPYKYPSYKSMKVEGNKVRISFINAETGLATKNGEPIDFTVAGDDKIFYKATAKIDGNTIVVSSPEVKKPVAVRFGYRNQSMPNLFSKEGLPVNLFRTDNWDNASVVEK
jgi:sialate O-acetylesterase